MAQQNLLQSDAGIAHELVVKVWNATDGLPVRHLLNYYTTFASSSKCKCT